MNTQNNGASRLYINEINKLWDECIKSTIIEISQSLGLKHKNLNYLERKIKNVYNDLKRNLIDTYMSVDSPDIDRHKIAACALKAIMIVKAVYIPWKAKLKFIFSKEKKLYEFIDTKFTEKDYKYFICANEYVAWSVATSIVDGFILIEDGKERLRHALLLPNPFPESDDDYLLDLCICLHYTKSRQLSTIMLSNTFFLLEKYSCRKIQCDNLEKAYIDKLLNDPNNDKDLDELKEEVRKIRLSLQSANEK